MPEECGCIQEVYSFTDNNTDEDIKSQLYLEKKHIERIWRIGKLINKASKCYGRNFECEDTFHGLLWIISCNNQDTLPFYNIINCESEGKLENIRIRALAVYKVAKICIKNNLSLPDKITPILRAVVTAYQHEKHILLKEKFAKTAARLTYLLKSRNSNEKFISNLVKIHSYPIIYHLQHLYKSEIVQLFDFYKDISNIEYLQIISEYIHPTIFSYFIENIKVILSLLPNEKLIHCIALIISKIPDTIIYFVQYLIIYLSDYPLKYTDPLKILKELLKEKIVEFIPYAACILLPLLSHLNTGQGDVVADVFSEILCAVMLDSPENQLSDDLQEYRRQGMEFISNLKGIYTLPKYDPRICLKDINLRDYQKEGIA